MKNLTKIALIIALLFFAKSGSAEIDLAKRLSGRILLQVESHGQAWYVNPVDLKRYYLGRPDDAFNLMRRLGVGISNQDLAKLPVKEDNATDKSLAKINAGKIFLQVESYGQAWYVSPIDLKRYYLSRPDDAFNLMRGQGLGIRETDINKITIGYLSMQNSTATPSSSSSNTNPTVTDEAKKVIDNAASAIRSNNTATVKNYFTQEAQKLVEYTMSVLDSDGRLLLGNMLSATSLKSSTADEKIYSAEIYVGIVGRKVQVNFHVKKQTDGTWLITNL